MEQRQKLSTSDVRITNESLFHLHAIFTNLVSDLLFALFPIFVGSIVMRVTEAGIDAADFYRIELEHRAQSHFDATHFVGGNCHRRQKKFVTVAISLSRKQPRQIIMDLHALR